MAGIDYEPVYTVHPHPKVRQIPYIELNGDNVPDSNMIIAKLTDKFTGLQADKQLSTQQRAISHALTVMVEHHTAQVCS